MAVLALWASVVVDKKDRMIQALEMKGNGATRERDGLFRFRMNRVQRQIYRLEASNSFVIFSFLFSEYDRRLYFFLYLSNQGLV
jgi:hypothetical protein